MFAEVIGTFLFPPLIYIFSLCIKHLILCWRHTQGTFIRNVYLLRNKELYEELIEIGKLSWDVFCFMIGAIRYVVTKSFEGIQEVLIQKGSFAGYRIIPVKIDGTEFTTVVGIKDERAIKLAECICNSKIDLMRSQLIPCGLINQGSWCYINATLQALLAISPMSSFYKSLKEFLNTNVNDTSTPLTDSMIALFNEFECMNQSVMSEKQSEELRIGPSFEPKCIYNLLTAMKIALFEKGRQEDAEEFLSYLLNGIHDELAALSKLLLKKIKIYDSSWFHVGPPKKELADRKIIPDSSIIKQIFGGMIRSSVEQNGVKESTTLQPFFTLQLDIQGENIWSLGNALEAYFVKENLQGFTCSKTNVEVEASRELSIEELPLVFIFHLKYFVYDRTGGSQKLYKPIDIPVNLKIPQDFLSPSLKDSSYGFKYRLKAVIYHHGEHAVGGHYTTTVHHSSQFGWVNFDNDMIKTLCVSEVLRRQQGSVPYLLFYEKQ